MQRVSKLLDGSLAWFSRPELDIDISGHRCQADFIFFMLIVDKFFFEQGPSIPGVWIHGQPFTSLTVTTSAFDTAPSQNSPRQNSPVKIARPQNGPL